MKPFSLYIHIPFCLHKCPYCDFNTYAVSHVPEREYTDALLAELEYRAGLPEWYGRPLQTIFFGGGTPSLFSSESISKILNAARSYFSLRAGAEVSLEANPGSVSLESLAGYAAAGINRLSFGAQSFNPRILKTLGRLHTPDQAHSAAELSRSAGINNFNLDLIYGVLEQTIDELKADIETALSLNPAHISAYNLTIEEGTPFYSAWKRGALVCPAEARVVEMMELLNEALPAHGLARYEISNYSRPGKEALHNLAYWNGDDYIGLGAGAHSFNRQQSSHHAKGGVRWSNYAVVSQYSKAALASGNAESWREELDEESGMFEFFFLGLRKISGVSLEQFDAQFETTFDAVYPELRSFLQQQKLATFDAGALRLTSTGMLLTDSVLEHFAKPDAKKASSGTRVNGLVSIDSKHAVG